MIDGNVDHRRRRYGGNRFRAARSRREAFGAELAQTIQLGIEYDPHPPFDAGSPERADPALVEKTRADAAQAPVRAAEGRGRSGREALNAMTAPLPAAYEVRAHNGAAASENKIHDDTVAQRFGFKGALVPGVAVFAYMAHQPVARWGRAFLERGARTAGFRSPCTTARWRG